MSVKCVKKENTILLSEKKGLAHKEGFFYIGLQVVKIEYPCIK